MWCSLSGFPCSSTPPTSRLTSRRQDLRSPSWSCRWVAQLNIASNIKSSAKHRLLSNIRQLPPYYHQWKFSDGHPWWNSEEKTFCQRVPPSKQSHCWCAQEKDVERQKTFLQRLVVKYWDRLSRPQLNCRQWKSKIQPALQLLKGSEWAIHKCKREQNTAEI